MTDTKKLLGCGVVAGPIYVTVSLVQALTREGFDPTRHAWSLLSNGDLGWIQITNFVLTGLLVIGCAVGLRRASLGRWAPRLIGVYGVSLICAGVFRADPALGFPPGTPDGATEVSWHGILHFVAGGVGFGCLIAACLVAARYFARVFSVVTGVVLAAGFGGVASGAGPTLGLVAAVLLTWAWLSALAVHYYRKD
jgi:hypothetical membrane protein